MVGITITQHFMVGTQRAASLRGFAIAMLLSLPACGGDTTPSGSNSQSASDTVYTVSQNGERPACSVTPVNSAVDIISEPGGGIVSGRLPADQWVQVSQRNDEGWYQVTDGGTPVDGGWIAPRGVNLQQPCACGPHCMIFETISPESNITDCEVAFTDGEFVRVMFLPDETASVFAVSTAGDDAAGLALARTDGWIGFDPGVAQADRQGMERLRWVHDNGDATISGEHCANLPVYTVQRVE